MSELDWRDELAEYRRRARSRISVMQSVRQIYKARGLDLRKVRQAIYSKNPKNDRRCFVAVLRRFLAEE